MSDNIFEHNNSNFDYFNSFLINGDRDHSNLIDFDLKESGAKIDFELNDLENFNQTDTNTVFLETEII